MSKFIASAAIRGAHEVVRRAEEKWQEAVARYGANTKVEFTNTAYYLPIILGFTGIEVATLGDMGPIIAYLKKLLHPVPQANLWTPYLGPTLDAGVATIMAEELLMGIGFVEGVQPEKKMLNGQDYTFNGPIDDIQLRSWGIQLVDGRMPGFVALLGRAKSTEVAEKLIREFQRRSILVFLSGNVDGVGIVEQALQAGVELGYDTYTVPFGSDTESTSYALGFATRAALTFGGLKGGMIKEILEYSQARTFAFALALGHIDDVKYATAAGAINYGFPALGDTRVPNIHASGITSYEAVYAMPWDDIPGKDDMEKAERLAQKCIEVRGVKIKITDVPIPVAYGSAFEGERVRRADMRVEFGGKDSRCFEYLRMVDMDQVEDHKIQVIGPNFDELPEGGSMDMGILVEVAGRQMQLDFEPVLERQIHYFVNGASGVQHIGQRDIAWIRISKTAVDKGFRLEHFGEILYARMHGDFGAILDKVQVKIITDPALHAEWLEKAREAYNFRNQRLAEMTDESVDEFYSCTLCQSFAPDHVCVVSPERLGLCGAYNWLDCKASFQINPTGPNQPISKGNAVDAWTGIFDNVNGFVRQASHGSVENVTMYSIMEFPMTSCGCFECIMMILPLCNGFMVVSREDPSMTPAGMTFSTLAGMAGGGLQTPGVLGIGKYFIVSKKFIRADGGLKRIVWMSSFLKETMAEELKEAAIREGDPDLITKIADERVATTEEEVLVYLEEKGHPALTLDPLI
ncbi:MAG: acetyl-CoA decarbonylase/synthase complex subunit alpha/beta [Chloroflexota bacterium]